MIKKEYGKENSKCHGIGERMLKNKNIFLILIFFILVSCSSIPKNTADGCSIFSERYLWYKHAKKAEKKWGTPIYLQLAIIKMESL